MGAMLMKGVREAEVAASAGYPNRLRQIIGSYNLTFAGRETEVAASAAHPNGLCKIMGSFNLTSAIVSVNAAV